jgi:DNA-binding protein H-NS
MENFIKVALNRNSLKSLIKNFYIDELEKFSNNIIIIIEQRKEQENKLKEIHKEKMQKISQVKSLLEKEGLSIKDLIEDPIQNLIKPKKIKKKLPPRYRLVDMENVTHEWTGRGLTPKVFQRYFDLGHTKESCLIIENVSL